MPGPGKKVLCFLSLSTSYPCSIVFPFCLLKFLRTQKLLPNLLCVFSTRLGMKLGADGCRETWGTGRAGIWRARVRRGLPGCERPGAAVAQAPTRAQQGILVDRPYYLAGMVLGRASSGSMLCRERWPSCQVHGNQNQEKCTHTVQANTDSWKSIPH